MELRVAFLGTPRFAVPSLERLVEAGFDIAVVVTQPDRPKGRGRQLLASPVKETALRLGIPVYQPAELKPPEVAEYLRGLNLDAMAVVAYGKIIPQPILDIPPLGLVNVHSSLLPLYRGAAPMQWAIANGETTTGVTTMLIDAGMDTGDILLAEETEISPQETAVELSNRLAPMGARLLVTTLRGLSEGKITPRKQDHDRATYAPMLSKEDGLINWEWTAPAIGNRVLGFQPWPGAHTTFRESSLNIWKAQAVEDVPVEAPGTLHPERHRLYVSCGNETALELLEVQMEGRKRMPADAFMNGQHVAVNERLGDN